MRGLFAVLTAVTLGFTLGAYFGYRGALEDAQAIYERRPR